MLIYICFSIIKSSRCHLNLPSQLFSSHSAVRSSWGTSETKLSCWSSASCVLCSLVSGRLGCSWIFIVELCNNSTMSPNIYCSPKPKNVCSNSTPLARNLPSHSCWCTQHRNHNHRWVPLDTSWPLACKKRPSICAPVTFLLWETQGDCLGLLFLITAGSWQSCRLLTGARDEGKDFVFP